MNDHREIASVNLHRAMVKAGQNKMKRKRQAGSKAIIGTRSGSREPRHTVWPYGYLLMHIYLPTSTRHLDSFLLRIAD
jgi:hypothetical protein